MFEPPFEESAVGRAGVFDGSNPAVLANPGAKFVRMNFFPLISAATFSPLGA